MNAPLTISGHALLGEDLVLQPVDIVIEQGRVTAIEDNPRAPDIWICPAFFNAHTHLADTIAMFSEMAFAATVYRLDPRTVLRSAIAGSTLSGSGFFIRKGERATLFTLDPSQSALEFSRDPVASIVKRAPVSQIRNNVFNL